MLKGKKVNVRPLESRDLNWFTEWNNDPCYTGPYEPMDVSGRDAIEKWFSQENSNSWWVIEDKDGNPVGQVITGPDSTHQFIGYIVHPDSRGKGYCTEALEIMVDYLFLSRNIVRVQAETNPENTPSIRILEKVGFTFEGVRRMVFFSQGKFNDGSMYSILRDEWEPRVLSKDSKI
ncbi:GNAT family N-acetyltransferase [Candidatus Bathyarchaeota archaeon]|jgi:[ribosomal protein S5]-alanine N-acetyltransferase|nr:GNAT family N-acetyltransferase [Candidatus Bathyarchaeota archaeon]MBT4320914.1 GNAT family N-acetyltransferase [Candidatus Bathyarchaeota archaeon]MBT4423187.1 GNAT family N-acetyltransferase [Candidatus Bathyarchaeota archaeon]MBT6605950.1 GNAT family N-acetyltransferase [Candidatus Bathyarchaeota archaeon]MBT7187189.1 GNAT family N-acetyltransferase [Candidatus Bathyarchaeota archaeon]